MERIAVLLQTANLEANTPAPVDAAKGGMDEIEGQQTTQGVGVVQGEAIIGSTCRYLHHFIFNLPPREGGDPPHGASGELAAVHTPYSTRADATDRKLEGSILSG
jgi:hypothetical protein